MRDEPTPGNNRQARSSLCWNIPMQHIKDEGNNAPSANPKVITMTRKSTVAYALQFIKVIPGDNDKRRE
jgi:alpha-D-ribose 1-methylphosphonate 5-triphosphate synthase subunit PhnL